jgi:glycerophosphoryl diester phosphodiesterase
MRAASVHRPLLLGHRGARALKSIPENTIASFDWCLADGCDGFEFDVRMTADGVAVVCHDPQFQRVEIARTGCRELPELPKLEDVLARYGERAFLDIELKIGGLEKIVAELLGEHPARRGFVVSSFLPEVLQALRARDATIPLGLICETRAELARWHQLPINYVMPRWELVNPGLMAHFKATGKKTLVWTVNDSKKMGTLARLGVDGIISDDTALLCRVLRP